jgi:hypothetical protein
MSLSVVLTGEFGQDRDDLVAQLSSAGLKYTTDLSKKVCWRSLVFASRMPSRPNRRATCIYLVLN